ncbi:MAG: threonine--tRNA ligase [Polyangiaceae bacterium]|jgi:threonyl-tRNA synthetase|nr:threonine--tRNA ligase [Polyangiaceae bacterium]
MERKTPREWLAAEGRLSDDVVAVKIGKKLVDLHTPVDTALLTPGTTPVRSSDPEALDVIRHSAAHVMADAVQRLFPGTKVTIGPAVEDGFYYDFHRTDGAFTEQDLARIEAEMASLIKKNTPFRRDVIARNDALAMFEKMGESFKCEIIRSIPEGEEISLYRHGGSQEWVDVCEGPHVPSTGFLGAVKLTSVAGAYWRGDERNPMLQRVYGTAFPTRAQLDEHLRLLEEARARDHRKLGKELDLFLFDEVAPAMPFFLPRGAHVYNQLVSYVRSLYDRDGYDEVITPQAFHPSLFRTSGHLGNYNDNMYRLWTEDGFEPDPERDAFNRARVREVMQQESFALKPMNCPSHCVIFGSRRRSYRELPMRVADFGRLHRYERGGTVHGLSRVRSFAQDDAHIFCSQEQVSVEIERFIRMLYEVYQTFKFDHIDIKLALRPEKRIGSAELWDSAEGALEVGLKAAGLPFEFLPGEGAFYGPKIEFHVKDALKRSWQLGTIQFDPNLPERFELSYVGQDGKEHRPIMLHRAILGSLERFMSVYIEHCGGNFPTWIAPRHCIVLTVSEKTNEHAQKVVDRLRARGIRADADLSADKLGAKIRNARLMRYPYLCVVGPKEAEADAVGVRSRERGELGAMPVDAFLDLLLDEIAARR